MGTTFKGIENKNIQYLLDAAIELCAVAELRGDDELPHPAHDDRLWTARMQDAWHGLREAIEFIVPDAVHDEVMNSKAQECL